MATAILPEEEPSGEVFGRESDFLGINPAEIRANVNQEACNCDDCQAAQRWATIEADLEQRERETGS